MCHTTVARARSFSSSREGDPAVESRRSLCAAAAGFDADGRRRALDDIAKADGLV